MNSVTSKFKWRRITPRGDDYSEVEILIVPSSDGYRFLSEVDAALLPDSRFLHSIEEGILLAFVKASVEFGRYQAKLVAAKDLTGQATPVGFRECAMGATLCCLGRQELAPNPGLIDQ